MSDPARTSLFDLTDDEADIAAGRVVSLAAVRRWLLSWETSDELPPPQCDE